jgi:hypothetical protein
VSELFRPRATHCRVSGFEYMDREPDETSPASPRAPSGGIAMLLLIVLALVVAAFLAWALISRSASAPTPAATADPKVPPAGAR